MYVCMFACLLVCFQPWRWRQHVAPKHYPTVHTTNCIKILDRKFRGKLFYSPSDDKTLQKCIENFVGEKACHMIWTIDNYHLSCYATQSQIFTFMAHNSQRNNIEVIHKFRGLRDFRSSDIGHSDHIIASIIQQSGHTQPQRFVLFLQAFHSLSILLKVDQHRQWHALHNISVKTEVKVALCMPWRYMWGVQTHLHSCSILANG